MAFKMHGMSFHDQTRNEALDGVSHMKQKHTTHGNPSKYHLGSGKTVDSADIDEGNLSAIQRGKGGGVQWVVVQEDTEKYPAGTKLYLPKGYKAPEK
tara:strand:- start:2178 stop:2468 length:291 start_codon:yes stop_codon:yes gene_type:complete